MTFFVSITVFTVVLRKIQIVWPPLGCFMRVGGYGQKSPVKQSMVV